jgi:tetratricopeptide (TPR) repeat protein
MKQGKLEYSELVLNKLLSGSPTIDQNQWFQIIQNLASVYMRKGDYSLSNNVIEKAEDSTRDRLFLACLKNLRGHLRIHEGKYDEGMAILSSSIRAFYTFNIPILLSIAYNNRGVIYFIKGKYEDAEKDWLKATKFAKKALSEYSEVNISLNLADIEMMKGDFTKAEKILERASNFYNQCNDLEKLATTEFNFALLEIEKGCFENAYEHFLMSESIAFPLPSPWDRKIRREEISSRAMERGYPEMKKLINALKND